MSTPPRPPRQRWSLRRAHGSGSARGAAEGWATRLLWQAVAIAGTAALLVFLRLTRGALYLANDKRNQYVPVLQDMGRRLRAGDFPAVDPNLGSGGNFSLDIQYGLFDPLHLGGGHPACPSWTTPTWPGGCCRCPSS